MSTSAPRTRHLGGILNVLVAVVVLAIVVPLALLSNQAPPPAIAEFAPQAQAQHQSSQQSSQFGNANGDELGQGAVGLTPSASPTPESSPPPTYLASETKHCIGALQTPDPQSPPCIPYWSGNNGGATYPQGVDGHYVNVSIGQLPGDQTAINDLVTYFNTNYELYDRQLKIVYGTPTLFAATDPSSQQKYAEQAKQAGVFMSGSFSAYGTEGVYYKYLAGGGVLGVDQNPTQGTEDDWTNLAPYEWSAIAGFDKQQRYLASFVCQTLANKPPDLAPPQPTPASPGGATKRVFALVVGKSENNAEDPPTPSILTSALSQCGADVSKTTYNLSGAGPNAAYQQQAQAAMTDMIGKSVTTVICLCAGDYLLYGLFPQASGQHKYPEWLVTSYGDLDRADDEVGYPADQMSHVFGLTWRNKQLPLANEWWYQAIKSVDPSYQYSDQTSYDLRWAYQDLMFIATGVQEAGPTLTPGSFQAGLFRTQFPDPGAGAAPYYQATIGYGVGDHSEYQDVALIYYDPAGHADDNSKQTGVYCYVANGRRFAPGTFPSSDSGFFNPPTC